MPASEASWLSHLSQVLYYLAHISVLGPLLVGLWRWHVLPKMFQPVVWCCTMWAVLIPFAEYAAYAWHYNVAFWHVMRVLEGLLLGYAYYLALRAPALRQALRWLAPAFVVLALADSLVLSGWWKLNIYTIAVECTGLIALALLYFEQVLHELRNMDLRQDPMFVLSVGVLVYFAGTVTLFVLQRDVQDLQQLDLMLLINSVMSLLLSYTVGRALWLAGRASNPPLAAKSF